MATPHDGRRAKQALIKVEVFLVETLKSVKLGKNVSEQKERLVEKVKTNSRGNSRISGDGSSSGNSNSGTQAAEEEHGYGEDITKVPCSSLQNKLQSGLLDKKKKSGFKTWESLYCVVSGNIFYLYKKQTDSKQKEAFCLTGYEFHENPSLDSGRKEMCFELTKPGSATYQFRASSKDGMIEWRDSIAKGIQLTSGGPGDEEEPGENYEDVGVEEEAASTAKPAAPDDKSIEFEDPDDIYEECGDDLFPAPPPALVAEEETEPPDDIYDACMSSPGDNEDSSSSSNLRPPPPPPQGKPRDPSPTSAPPRPPKSELPALPKAALPPPPVPDRKLSSGDLSSADSQAAPPLPANPPPLPSRGGGSTARVPHLRKPFMDREEDFENIFCGKWDCSAESNKELAFKRGDLIHVLSRDFDAEDWWVGELGGKIGLVPKQYLCPAFELVR
ncbi:hypothetical protein BaRGS_00031709 [Batillaria attramentaria]|uniref:Src kinase-associated phosphoprotein 2 n=1 Tax=Batillaria attramentaria TaxID=370345 RepID=A0ABD0JQT2_9CAEN